MVDDHSPNYSQLKVKVKENPVNECPFFRDKMNITYIIEKEANGYYAYCPQLQGCYSQGETYEEALGNIKDAVQLHMADRSCN